MKEVIDKVIGTSQDIEWWQMCIRAVIIFIVAIILVRISNKRVFGKHSAFDIVLGFILGSTLSRAINGTSEFLATIAAATVLVLAHRLLNYLAWKSGWFGYLVKGHHQMLVEDGDINWEVMSSKNITRNDLDEAIRTQGNVPKVEDLKYAFLERSGDISVIPKTK